jgi:preprotein translocase SecE subunit
VAEESKIERTKAASIDGGGFFTIRRRGQGKWTRIGTAIGSSLIIVGIALFIYYDVRANVKMEEKTALIIAGVFFLLSSLLAFWLQNKADHVAFLIDTDSEMKKVNWTSRQELIGSTRIVIGFMLIMAGMLFIVDILFGYLFWGVGVLKFSPGFFESIFKH